MNDDFYIGYQKVMPPGLAVFLRKRILIFLGLTLLIAVMLVAAQKPFASGRFEFGVRKSFSGMVSEYPYPTLILDQPDGDRQTVARSRFFLVAPGKHGAQKYLSGLDGKKVNVDGSLIYRDKTSMIEIQPDSIQVIEDADSASSTRESLGEFTLRGEIVDSKCYLGVMKPGNLKPHKSCAIRCISGGITPLLCVRDEQGYALYIMLAGINGEAINQDVIPFVAEPVEISGQIECTDDVLLMKIDPAKIRRL